MKKLFILSSFLFISYAGFSQEAGIRGGDVLGNDIALDLILRSSSATRIHADLGFGSNFGLEVLFDFVNRGLGDGGLSFYLGLGPSFLFTEDFLWGLSAEAGLEFHFNNLPLAIGADWRPTYYFDDNIDFEAGGWGVNARFDFGGRGE